MSLLWCLTLRPDADDTFLVFRIEILITVLGKAHLQPILLIVSLNVIGVFREIEQRIAVWLFTVVICVVGCNTQARVDIVQRHLDADLKALHGSVFAVVFNSHSYTGKTIITQINDLGISLVGLKTNRLRF